MGATPKFKVGDLVVIKKTCKGAFIISECSRVSGCFLYKLFGINNAEFADGVIARAIDPDTIRFKSAIESKVRTRDVFCGKKCEYNYQQECSLFQTTLDCQEGDCYRCWDCLDFFGNYHD